jgi:serine/threonine protein kinase
MPDQIAPAELFAHDPSHFLRRGPGRETFAYEAPGGQRLIIKRYTRSPRLAQAEFDCLRRLGEAGLAVPRALELVKSRRGGLVIMEEVLHQSDLRQCLQEFPSEARGRLDEVLALTLGLHGRGWHHRDLYLDHFIVSEAGCLVLIDFGRARQTRWLRRRWLVKDLAALLYSTPRGVGPRLRLRFLAAYLDGRGITARRERRWWARAVAAKAQRMAAHTPRGGVTWVNGLEVVN